MRLFRIRLPPEWGTDPVPREHRRLRGADLLVLWFSLGIGLLVLAAGAVLTKAPANFGFGLTLTEAAVVAVLGS
ncbi:MAG TPA: hypothetical protein VGR51_04100, partial [Thermoplasmata archaeon]|nr:hypothetical protein [Thermoplasmata archaeon]